MVVAKETRERTKGIMRRTKGMMARTKGKKIDQGQEWKDQEK